MTTFVLPNSYCYNEEHSIDGKKLTVSIEGMGEADRRIYLDGEDVPWDDSYACLDKKLLMTE